MKAYESALAIRQKLADANPTVTEFQSDLATSHNNIGNLLSDTGKPAEALKAYESALAIRRKLADANPTVTQFQSDLATQLQQHRHPAQRATGKPAEALKAYESALAIRQKLADANPTVTEFQSDLAGSHNNIGNLLSEHRQAAEALKAYESALAIQQKLAREHPESPDFASDLGATLNNLAMIDLDAKRFEEARVRLREAVEWQRKALASNPGNPTYRQVPGQPLDQPDPGRTEGWATPKAWPRRSVSWRSCAIRTRRWWPSTRGCPRSSGAINSPRTIPNGSNSPREPTTRRSTPPRRSSGPKPSTPTPSWPRIARPRLATTPPAPPRWPGAARGRTTRPSTTRRRRSSASRLADWLQAELAVWTKFVESGPPQPEAVHRPDPPALAERRRPRRRANPGRRGPARGRAGRLEDSLGRRGNLAGQGPSPGRAREVARDRAESSKPPRIPGQVELS